MRRDESAAIRGAPRALMLVGWLAWLASLLLIDRMPTLSALAAFAASALLLGGLLTSRLQLGLTRTLLWVAALLMLGWGILVAAGVI